MTRLTYDDDLFLRMECVLDVPVVNQIVWRFDDVVRVDHLSEMWKNLAAGPIHRRVERTRIPGARDRWARGTDALPLDVSDDAVPESGIGQWMQDKAAVSLDPVLGQVWQLAVTAVEGGGSVVSLVASHVVGDGGALTSAAIAALRGTADPDDFRSVWDERETPDARDAVDRIGAAAAGIATVLGRSLRSIVTRAPTAPAPITAGQVKASRPTAFGEFTPSTVVVDCPTDRWISVAKSVGGSANSLLVAVALGILESSGRVDETDAVKVSLPVSTRVSGDTRANATSGVSIRVAGGGGYRQDLSAVRRDSKEAFTTLADATQSTTFELTKPLMQMLPDAVVARAARSATAPMCLCSNLGDRGVGLRSIGDRIARSVAMRSITQNTTAELLRRTKGGVSVWWNTSGESATLCVTGLDPDRFPTAEHLRELVAEEYERWQLTPTFW